MADVFDHNVHVLDRKEDNALVSVKVNSEKFKQYEHALFIFFTAHFFFYSTFLESIFPQINWYT